MTKAAYWARGDYNAEFAARITAEEDAGWAVTALFYSALHYVNGHLGGLIQANTRHKDRDHLIRNNQAARTIFAEYKRLQARSEVARYDCSITIPLAEVEELKKRDHDKIMKKLVVRSA